MVKSWRGRGIFSGGIFFSAGKGNGPVRVLSSESELVLGSFKSQEWHFYLKSLQL